MNILLLIIAIGLVLITQTFLIIEVIKQAKKKSKKLGYQKGQIDAIKGNIKYTLVEYSDGEREWRKISELDDEVKVIPNTK